MIFYQESLFRGRFISEMMIRIMRWISENTIFKASFFVVA